MASPLVYSQDELADTARAISKAIPCITALECKADPACKAPTDCNALLTKAMGNTNVSDACCYTISVTK